MAAWPASPGLRPRAAVGMVIDPMPASWLLSINILDMSVLAAQVSQRAYDDLDTRSGGIVNTYLTPFASAVDTLMSHGNPRVHLES